MVMLGNNTRFKIRRMKGKIAVIFIMVFALSNVFSVIAFKNVNANTSISDYFIESRFMLWDSNEKMLDENFNIHIFYINETNNNTFHYYIRIDNDIYTNVTTYHYNVSIHKNSRDIINVLEIRINNETILFANNIKILSGVSESGIRRSVSDYLISLSPFEISSKLKNVFYSSIVGAILGLFLAFRIIKKYRAKYGMIIIED